MTKLNYINNCPFCKKLLTFYLNSFYSKYCKCHNGWISYEIDYENFYVDYYRIIIKNHEMYLSSSAKSNRTIIHSKEDNSKNYIQYDFYMELDWRDPIKSSINIYEKLSKLKEFI
jgi:hypothetical protein